MLEPLHVKNLALIEEIEVEFGPGLNILTGETGAGKSILLGSMQLILGAKTSKAAARLSNQVREKVFKKKYLVIANGKFKNDKGTLQDYLLKNERTNTSKVVKEGTKNSKYAELDYEVLKYDEELNLSVLKVNLHTGRHHQIRVQLSSRDHSIYGDQKYGGRGHGKQICLWAYELTIEHPITKEQMTFQDFPEKEKSWKKNHYASRIIIL